MKRLSLLRQSTGMLTILLGMAAPWCSRVAAEESPSALIDAEIQSALAMQGLPAVPRAEDAELLRRIYLDVLGRIPTPSETLKYLDETNSNKHHALIDALLVHEEMPSYWRGVFDEWFHGTLNERDFGRDGFLDYLARALRDNKPWSRIAYEMLAPDLRDENQRQAAYFLAMRVRGGDNEAKLDALTSGVASIFFGVQLQCAKCHDHPFVPQWKQDHYYGLAAFVGRTQDARLENTPIVREKAEGDVKFVTSTKQEKTARLMFLDSRVLDEPQAPTDRAKWYAKGEAGLPDSPYFSRRALLADYALNANSPFFKRAMVNRVWKQFMGRGLVEPVDQMHEANPASHPALLEKLADDFAGHGFDLRRLMSGILHSDAYARSSRWTSSVDRPKDQDYAVAILKPLTPDQLATSMGIATGHYDLWRAKVEREKKNRKIDELTPAVARALYGRERDVQDFAARFRTAGDTFESNPSQALFLSYNQLLDKQLQPAAGNLVERLAKQPDVERSVRDAFLVVLARSPNEAELRRGVEYLQAGQEPVAAKCRDLVWALLCSSEFRFNR